VHKFRGPRSFCRFGIENVLGGRGAFGRFDIRIDVTICRIRLSLAQTRPTSDKGMCAPTSRSTQVGSYYQMDQVTCGEVSAQDQSMKIG